MAEQRKRIRKITSTAPIRICDIGGWTDTWFAEHGRVLNIAVTPVVEVELDVFADHDSPARYTIHARNFGESYSIPQPNGNYHKHPLIEAALDYIPPPNGLALELSIFSHAPAGCSTGTSASVTVAVLGALQALRAGRPSAYEAASAAHRIETEFLHRQCGIQDQLAAAFGGVNLIEMASYPHAQVDRLELPKEIEQALEARLALIYVGRSHSSSGIHEMVIRRLEQAGANAPQLERLRKIAARSRDALLAGDFVAFGRAMVENTEAQSALHPQLVGAAHGEIIGIARQCGALGWKVNGAGGEGGSMTLLCPPDRGARESIVRTIEAANPAFHDIPIRLSPAGLQVRDFEDNSP